MMLRFALSLALLGAALFAGDEPAKPAKQEEQKSKRSWPRVRLGGVTVNAGYARYGGYPYYGYPYRYGAAAYPGYWGWGPYAFDPFFYGYGPFLHPGFFAGFGWQPSMGEVKVETGDKSAWVYLDGALAGRAGKLKTMWLEPGAYDIELRSGDRKTSQKIYVLSGKTLKVTPDLMEARR